VSDIRIVEVGPRDGLQNESKILTRDQRVELIQRLATSGLTTIEAGSFVSSRWVPQMEGSDQVLLALNETFENDTFKNNTVSFPVLTPNIKGYELAKAAGAKEVAIFGAASEAFSQKNINCSISESLDRFKDIAVQAKRDGIRIRGYVSCLVACPYEGVIKPAQVLPVVRSLMDMGCYEISLGDTIGRATPKSIDRVLTALLAEFSAQQLALHCHDTYGMAIANIVKALELGLRTFDASVGGAGGCPYATGASGNVATEDVVYLLENEGLASGIDLDLLVETGQWLYQQLGKPPVSKVNQALFGKQS